MKKNNTIFFYKKSEIDPTALVNASKVSADCSACHDATCCNGYTVKARNSGESGSEDMDLIDKILASGP